MKLETIAKKVTEYGKAITVTVSVIALIIAGFLYYMPRSTAEAQHANLIAQSEAGDAKLAEYDELGGIETQLELTQLSIKQYNILQEQRELRPDEVTEMAILLEKLSILQRRLLDIQAKIRAEQGA